MKPIIATLGLVLGPAALWWGLVLVNMARPEGSPADIATGALTAIAGMLLVVIGPVVFMIAAVLALAPVVRLIERELASDDAG